MLFSLTKLKISMDLSLLSIALAMFLCTLVAGFLLAFSIIVMPGLQTLDDFGFLNGFKVMDRIIQDNHPIFMIIWVGSVLAVLISGWFAFSSLQGVERLLVIAAVSLYLLGVQLPTATINIPLNNQLQSYELGSMDSAALQQARHIFEWRWIRWNSIRTIIAIIVAALLLVAIIRL